MAFIPLEKAHRLHEGYRQAFNVRGQQVLLLQADNRTYIIENRCPHMDAPLDYATVNNGFIRCPMHGIEFSLSNGLSKTGAGGCLKMFSVGYEGNQVGMEY